MTPDSKDFVSPLVISTLSKTPLGLNSGIKKQVHGITM
jgi:hypothetical protein